MAKQVGVSSQVIRRTSSGKTQTLLRPYERIARLLAIWSRTDFTEWLGRPSVHLGERTPLQLMDEGRIEVVVDLAEDTLLGSPS